MKLSDFLDEKGLLDKKKCLNGMPLSLKMALGPAIDWANSFDADNNKVPDIVQYMPAAIRVIQIAVAIAPHVSIPGVKAWFLGKSFVTNKEAVEAEFAHLEDLSKVVSTQLTAGK